MNGTILLTGSGKYGDILWMLPAARALHRHGCIVDFATMPAFAAIHPLMAAQPYLRAVFSIPGWEMVDDHCGARPRVPPFTPSGYDRVAHLTYKQRPTYPLIEHAFLALGLAMRLPEDAAPFLEIEPSARVMGPHVAYAFNGEAREVKARVRDALFRALPAWTGFVDVERLPFLEAARHIASAAFFLGCRSANWVVAQGVGARCLICEPNGGRREPIFSNPYGSPEVMPRQDDLAAFVETARGWMGDGE